MNEDGSKDELTPTIDVDVVKAMHESSHVESTFDNVENGRVSEDVRKLDCTDQQWPLRLTGILVFVLALATIYLWQQQAMLKRQLGDNPPPVIQTDLHKPDPQLSQQVQENQSKIDQLHKQQQYMAASLESRQGILLKQTTTSIAHLKALTLLSLANERYIIMRDISTTILAMQQALKQLDTTLYPELAPVRSQVLKELDSLLSVKKLNVDKYIVMLNEMILNVDFLELVTVHNLGKAEIDDDTTQPGSTWSLKWRQLLAALKPVLVIRRTQLTPQIIMTHEEERLIRLVLKSRYEYVRQALLREDDAMLPIAVQSAHAWLERYFDLQQAGLQQTLKTLSDLQVTQFRVEYPVIGESLNMLTQYISQLVETSPLQESGSTPGSAAELP